MSWHMDQLSDKVLFQEACLLCANIAKPERLFYPRCQPAIAQTGHEGLEAATLRAVLTARRAPRIETNMVDVQP